MPDGGALHRRALSARVPRHRSLTPAPEVSMIFFLMFVLSAGNWVMCVAHTTQAHNRRSHKTPLSISRRDPLQLLTTLGTRRTLESVFYKRCSSIFVFVETAMISKRLRNAIKNCGVPQYVLATLLPKPVNHSTLSAWLCGISPVRRGDPRIVQLGALLDVPPRACFAPSASRARATRRLRQQVAATVRRGKGRSRARLLAVHRDGR
jgi:hypothetical protein